MKKLFLSFVVALFALAAAADTPIVPAPIKRVSVFNNGVAAVLRTANPAPGEFIVAEKITPLQGSLWFSPADGLSVVKVKRSVTRPNEQPFEDIAAGFAGENVTLQLNGEKPQIFSGVVQPPHENDVRFVILKGADGKLTAIPANRIELIQCDAIKPEIQTEQTVWLFRPRVRIAGPLEMLYLTHGINWRTAYKLTLLPQGKMTLAGSVEIANHLEDLKAAELILATGSPDFKFSSNNSLLAIGGQLLRSSMMKNKLAAGAPAPANFENDFLDAASGMPASGMPASGTTEDMRFINLGAITLGKDEAVWLPLESGDGEFKRIVEWEIGRARNEYGRPNSESSGNLWDAIIFANPFKHPMTESSVEIFDGGAVLAQSGITWVNPGAEATLRTAKANSVEGKRFEYEEAEGGKDARQIVTIAGMRFRSVNVTGEIKLISYRKTPVEVRANLRYSGKLLSADGSPENRYLPSGVWAFNPQGELTWKIELKPGEELKFAYKYNVMVNF
ncbi:MAG: hypothetical protein PHI35_03735 [Victivallaceae bacterium]|nr:hypothetical protein [Victivallaceae bacterium]